MNILQTLFKAVVESAQLTATPPSDERKNHNQSYNQNRNLRYIGDVEGAQGVVDVHVKRIQDHYKNVFRISGAIKTPAGQWPFEVDGHSGYGKLHDDTIIHMYLSEQSCAIKINPYDRPAPAYHFQRT